MTASITTAHNVVNFNAYLLSKSSHIFFTLKIQNPGSLRKGYALIGFFCTCCYFIPETCVHWTRNKVIKSLKLLDWELNQQSLTLKINLKIRHRDRQADRLINGQMSRSGAKSFLIIILQVQSAKKNHVPLNNISLASSYVLICVLALERNLPCITKLTRQWVDALCPQRIKLVLLISLKALIIILK